jgi:hypothetical protein
MDARGAHVLHRAIEQNQHWRSAAGVRDGRQAQRDPDRSYLVEFVDGIRRYRFHDGSEFEKRLRGDVWT